MAAFCGRCLAGELLGRVKGHDERSYRVLIYGTPFSTCSRCGNLARFDA